MARHQEMLIFHALSQCPSLASAAQCLNVSGPTVMRAVARLEARLGVQLLSRSTRGVVLTEAGVGFMADCSRILKAVDEAEASAKGWHVQAQGNLTILLPALFSRYVMAPVLAGYMDLFPEIKVFAHYHDRFPNMHDEGLDVAVLVGPLPSCSLIARPVGSVRSLVCASPGYLAMQGEPVVPQDLHDHRLIATQANQDWVQWSFQQQGEANCVKARTRLSCATLQAAIDAAAHGAGLTRCLSYPLYDYLSSGRLRRVLQAYEPPSIPVHVVYRERRKAPMRVRSFVDYIVEHLRAHPALRADSA